jgi:hypothetical protein
VPGLTIMDSGPAVSNGRRGLTLAQQRMYSMFQVVAAAAVFDAAGARTGAVTAIAWVNALAECQLVHGDPERSGPEPLTFGLSPGRSMAVAGYYPCSTCWLRPSA